VTECLLMSVFLMEDLGSLVKKI